MKLTQPNATTRPTLLPLGLLPSLLLVLLAASSFAATPVADYQQRVTQAAQLAQTVAAATAPSAEQLNSLQTLKQLLPAQEEIETPGQFVQVDNRWLHETLARLDGNPPEPARLIIELTERLVVLQQRLPAVQLDNAAPARDKLERILAKPEYQQEQKQASAIKQWLENLMRQLRDLVRRLFGTRLPGQVQPSQFTINLMRMLIATVLGLGLLYTLFKLFRRFGQRGPSASSASGTREIMGEQFNENATTEDLLASARALAQNGDYRAAIRRAYIALLLELEQRGKLRLHRAKTNRDYLEALRAETAIYPSFVALTRIFERIWYGDAHATEFDFEGFLTGYRAAVNDE